MTLPSRPRVPTLSLIRALALAVLAAVVSCASPRPVPVVAHPELPPHLRPIGDYAERIDDAATWRALAASPGREMVAHTDVVKVIIDLEDNWRVYFLQSERWEIHYFFAARFLSRPGHLVSDHETFNRQQYRRDDRRFVLGTLAHYRDQNVWTYELIAGDTLDMARTVRAFKEVRRRVYMGNELRYRPVPPGQEPLVDQFRAQGVPVVTTQELFGSMRYQPLNPGEAYGYLRFIHGEPDAAHVHRTDIVVLDNVPLDLPVCAGIVTGELQTPLSHVSVLAANRGTPNMALRGAFNEPQLRALEGQLVRLHVSPQDWSVERSDTPHAERAWEARRPHSVVCPPMSLRDAGLPDVRSLHAHDLEIVGAKAAQLGELAQIGPQVPIPRAFALPFYAYHDHLVRNHLDAELAALEARPGFRDDPSVREQALREFQAHIASAPLRPVLAAGLRAQIRRMFPGTRVRLRSSTNAEDLVGFNGAGLYRSVVIPSDPTEEQIADGLRQVWASVWNFQGYEERAYFRITQSCVAMGVLVQESIDGDVVDGVAITANPFNQGRPGLFINAQVAGGEGGAVTSARGDDVPEQVVYYTYGEAREFERLSRSSRAHGAYVLSDDEVVNLSGVLRAIQTHFHPLDPQPSSEAMDVEFILAGPARRLVIVQARPYTVRWDEGRAWASEPE